MDFVELESCLYKIYHSILLVHILLTYNHFLVSYSIKFKAMNYIYILYCIQNLHTRTYDKIKSSGPVYTSNILIALKNISGIISNKKYYGGMRNCI